MTANEDALKDAMVRYLDEHFPLGELGSPTHIPAPLEVTDAFRAGYAAARASIGPDSERIRELEAENAELRAELLIRGRGYEPITNEMLDLLPGPDDIVVSREALEAWMANSTGPAELWRELANIRAALSQSQPKPGGGR